MLRPDTASRAAAWYLALTIVMSWPVAAGLARDVPSDLGDPLLNCWILAWNGRHLLRLLGGDPSALAEVWHTNIFHPAPYTLALSELLATQSLLGLPVYAATGNIVLTYNLLFLAAFALSGLGMFLFVRALTADWRAGFIAGLLFAFTPYRVNQAPHLQVMWSCFMPFVLLGLRRYFDAAAGTAASGPLRRLAPALALAGASLALVAQNLACGYYMFFFAPVVALYALYELASRRRLLDWRAWTALAATALAAVAMTWPFMRGYFALRTTGQDARELGQVARFSADALAYITAHSDLVFWGWLQTWPRPEGALFPGLMPVVLTLAALGAAVSRAASAPLPVARAGRWREWLGTACALLALVYLALTAGMFIGLEGLYRAGPIAIRLFDVSRLASIGFSAGLAALILSPAWRARTAALLAQPAVFAAGLVALAFWLSLGPEPTVGGNALREATPYPWLYAHVPGLDALRVPARFAMLVVFGLAWAAGLGYHALAPRLPRAAWLAVAALVLADAAAMPLPVNGPATTDTHHPPPPRVPVASTPFTDALAQLPPDAVVLAFPFGDVTWEIRQVYLSTFHWRRLVNGYSGGFPPSYERLRQALAPLPEDQQPHAWPLISSSGATHLAVMGAAYGPERAARLRQWLTDHGARLQQQIGDDSLFTLFPSSSGRPPQPPTP